MAAYRGRDHGHKSYMCTPATTCDESAQDGCCVEDAAAAARIASMMRRVSGVALRGRSLADHTFQDLAGLDLDCRAYLAVGVDLAGVGCPTSDRGTKSVDELAELCCRHA